MVVAKRSPDDPDARSDHSQPTEDIGGGGNGDVVWKQMPARENLLPVVLAAANQRQFLAARVGHVTGNVQPVLKKPDDRSCEGKRPPLPPEANSQDAGKHQLPDRPTVSFKSRAE